MAPVSHGRPRKWCSDRCRKTQYAGRCIDCGATLSGSNGRGEHASKRCLSCSGRVQAGIAAERQRALARPRWDEIAARYRAGATLSAISEEFGLWGPAHAGQILYRMRRAGYDLPHRRTPEQVERIRAGRWGQRTASASPRERRSDDTTLAAAPESKKRPSA